MHATLLRPDHFRVWQSLAEAECLRVLVTDFKLHCKQSAPESRRRRPESPSPEPRDSDETSAAVCRLCCSLLPPSACCLATGLSGLNRVRSADFYDFFRFSANFRYLFIYIVLSELSTATATPRTFRCNCCNCCNDCRNVTATWTYAWHAGMRREKLAKTAICHNSHNKFTKYRYLLRRTTHSSAKLAGTCREAPPPPLPPSLRRPPSPSVPSSWFATR